MTDAERVLWHALRGRRLEGYRFRRQHPVGNYIIDFACTKYRIAVEADGSQHGDSESDMRRTDWLERQGWRVVRFWNNDILTNIEGVTLLILEAMEAARVQHEDS